MPNVCCHHRNGPDSTASSSTLAAWRYRCTAWVGADRQGAFAPWNLKIASIDHLIQALDACIRWYVQRGDSRNARRGSARRSGTVIAPGALGNRERATLREPLAHSIRIAHHCLRHGTPAQCWIRVQACPIGGVTPIHVVTGARCAGGQYKLDSAGQGGLGSHRQLAAPLTVNAADP